LLNIYIVFKVKRHLWFYQSRWPLQQVEGVTFGYGVGNVSLSLFGLSGYQASSWYPAGVFYG